MQFEFDEPETIFGLGVTLLLLVGFILALTATIRWGISPRQLPKDYCYEMVVSRHSSYNTPLEDLEKCNFIHTSTSTKGN